jgi:transposase
MFDSACSRCLRRSDAAIHTRTCILSAEGAVGHCSGQHEYGVTALFCCLLQAAVPELGTLNQREIAKLVGLAPLHDDSGKRSGARHIRGGRAAVRAVLYMATLTATRCNPVIKAFYQRLLRRGKIQKVALTAAMRTLLVILNTMVKTQTPWNATLHQRP